MIFKPSTLKDRKSFYSKEFNEKKALSFFKVKPGYFAVDLGTETKITKNPRKDNKLIFFRTKTLRKKLLQYLPEDVYYDRNLHKGNKVCKFCFKTKNFFKCKNFLGQELVFDIDANNLDCNCRDVCNKCIIKSIENAFKLKEKLDFKKIIIVYSGRGCHVHVFDKKAYTFGIKERKELAKRFENYGLDKWVTEGRIRLIRLPYSLNAVVSRIVLPIQNKNSFNMKKTLPKFIG